MNTLFYFLTVSLYLFLFYGCYVVLLRRNTFFELNRGYLIATVICSLLLPFVKLPGGAPEALPVGSITLPTFVVGNVSTAENDGWSITYWFWLTYGIGVAGMLVRLGINLWAVLRLIRSGTKEYKPTYTLVRLSDESIPSFSFGRYVVLNQADSVSESDALLRHEEAHIHQFHTADIIFLEIVQIAFWFNPVLRLYKRALQEVHEFLADRAVLKTPQPDYPQQLVAYALNVSPTILITPFVSKSTLKQRIIMLQKPASQRWALLGYVLALPLAALLSMCTQSERDQPQSEAARAQLATSNRVVKVEGEIFTVVEQQPEFQGGMAELGNYIHKHLKYPANAEKAKVEGKVFLNFIVTKTGEINDIRILKGIGYGIDEEAIRVVSQMPRWEPGMQNGQAVNVRFNLPIRFQLDDKQTDTANPFKAVSHFIIDGKEVTKEKLTALSPNKIVRMDVNKDKSEIRVTTRK